MAFFACVAHIDKNGFIFQMKNIQLKQQYYSFLFNDIIINQVKLFAK